MSGKERVRRRKEKVLIVKMISVYCVKKLS